MMNLADVRQLPVVFICDNNQWACSTPTHLGYAVEHLADRAPSAYGFEGVVVDGTDVLAVYRELKAAIRRPGRAANAARAEDIADGGTRRPRRRLLRPQGASSRNWAKNDPIERFRTWLRENAELSGEEEEEISGRVKKL